MAYLKPTPTTEENILVGKISDGLSVKLPTPPAAVATGLTGVGVTNGQLTWTAVEEGDAGNGITIIQQDPQAFSQSLSITVNGKIIIISLATGADPGLITTTAALLKTAIEAKAEAAALVTVVYNGTGAGLCRDENVVLAGGYTALTPKKFYLIDHFFGMAMDDGSVGEVVLDLEEAEYETDQLLEGDTFALGAKVYWDDTNKWFTETAGGLTLVGIVTKALSEDGVIWFKLTNSVI